MTLPNPRIDYRVDPTGADERLRQSAVGGSFVVPPGGLVTVTHAILAGANRYAQRNPAQCPRYFDARRPRRQEPRHG